MKSARGLSHFIKLEYVAVHGNLNKTYPRRVLYIQLTGSVKLGGLHGKRGSEFKTKFVKYPNKEHTSTALGSLPLARLGHVTELFQRIDCAITSTILAVILSDQNNPTNGVFFFIIVSRFVTGRFSNIAIIQVTTALGRNLNMNPCLPIQHCACVHDKRALPMRVLKSAAFLPHDHWEDSMFE